MPCQVSSRGLFLLLTVREECCAQHSVGNVEPLLSPWLAELRADEHAFGAQMSLELFRDARLPRTLESPRKLLRVCICFIGDLVQHACDRRR